MKKLIFTNVTFIACCILLFAVYLTSCCDCNNNITFSKKVSAGQIWVYETNNNNPFKVTKVDTMYVIAVREGYVQYRKNGKIDSETINWFKVGSRRIK